MRLPKVLKSLARIFSQHGFECYLVGGAVRDFIMKRSSSDFDIATDAVPEQVQKIFKRVIPTGIKHGTVTVLYKQNRFEVTTYRLDGVYSDLRHPDSVDYSSSIKEDLQRRDFTINALAYDLVNSRLLDPHKGLEDIRNRTVRAIGDPMQRFHEDALRNLRACRIAAQLDFQIDTATMSAIRETALLIHSVSSERVRDELQKIIQSSNLIMGFELLDDSGLLELIIPELSACKGIKQRQFHRYDVFYHSLHACAGVPQSDLVVRLAALLHDIGKPPTLSYMGGEPRFLGHDRLSADMTGEILKRLKFPNSVITRVVNLVRHHMFSCGREITDSAIRRLIVRVGKENINALIALRRADQHAMALPPSAGREFSDFIRRLDTLLESDNAFTLNDLKINGSTIMKSLNLKPGPRIGIILNFLLECVIDDPELNQPEKLLSIAGQFNSQRLDINQQKF